VSARQRFKAWIIAQLVAFVVFLRTRPKEYFFYGLKMAKATAKQVVVPIEAYQSATKLQRLAVVTLLALAVGSAWVLKHNFMGVWLPAINEPLLRTFEPLADHVETYQRKDNGESFYAAFPQERYEFLFPKLKVNLRRTAENPNPMGAFEIIVLMDSKDTAIEARDREVEFFDLLSRVFEDETFNDLETELGKGRLKSRLKHELNQKLTQGWVKDISFKTFILKP
jgi:flagellar basal body-associated protein FliL